MTRLADLVKQIALSILDHSRHRGHDLWRDMQFFHRQLSEASDPSTIQLIDVGANVGQTAVCMARHFPDARVHAFEPFPQTFRELQANTSRFRGIICNEAACGDKVGTAQLHLTDYSTTHTIRNIGSTNTIEVAVTTIDAYASRLALGRVFLLKSDTEGFDLQVLSGANSLIEGKLVDYILVETALLRKMSLPQSDFFEVATWLAEKGYHFSHMYEAVYATKGGSILWGNALFTCH